MLDLAFGLTDTSRLGCQVEQDICDGLTRASCRLLYSEHVTEALLSVGRKTGSITHYQVHYIRIYTYILDI